MSQSHHQEQMEAARSEFQKLWHGNILKRMQSLRVPISDYPKYEDVAWKTFCAAKKINLTQIHDHNA